VDRQDNPARFLILGSASRELLRQSSETLAGRIGYIELAPFSVSEVGPDQENAISGPHTEGPSWTCSSSTEAIRRA